VIALSATAGILLVLLSFELVSLWLEGGGYEFPPVGQEDLKVLLRTQDELNEHGYRDRSRTIARSPDHARVVVLGDSVTFGQGVPPAQIFTRVAEELLNGVEVLNFGQTGFDIQQVAALARHRTPSWKPDLIVYAFNTNDRVETKLVRVGNRRRPIYVGSDLSPVLGWFRRHSALVRLYLGARLSRDLAVTGVPEEDAQRVFFETWARRLVEAVGQTPLMVLTVPHHRLATSDCAGWSGDPRICLADEASLAHATRLFTELEVPLIHGRPVLTKLGPDALALPTDPHHPNAAGHAALGALLAARIQSSGPARLKSTTSP
jgi:lysophospholipase L1-like esterase